MIDIAHIVDEQIDKYFSKSRQFMTELLCQGGENYLHAVMRAIEIREDVHDLIEEGKIKEAMMMAETAPLPIIVFALISTGKTMEEFLNDAEKLCEIATTELAFAKKELGEENV